MPQGNHQVGRTIQCLDHGFVRLVDVMGDDAAIVQAARVSYGTGTKTYREDASLIDYLMRNHHTSPFEMCEFKFHCKMPIFVARQWIRHRTASVNETSARYSEMKDEFFIPESFRAQATRNKQVSEGTVEEAVNTVLDLNYRVSYEQAYKTYRDALEKGVGRELARIAMPVAAYTEWYWKIDLWNLLHFLRLRLDTHAQYEIRVYAEAIAGMVKAMMPMAWKAFEEHVLGAVTLSGSEVRGLREWFAKNPDPGLNDKAWAAFHKLTGMKPGKEE